MSDDFVDENAPWPLWRPLAGTAAGVVLLLACGLLWPAGRLDGIAPEGMYGQLVGRAIVPYAGLYFPAYSRRGLAWRLGAFVLMAAASILGNIVATAGRP